MKHLTPMELTGSVGKRISEFFVDFETFCGVDMSLIKLAHVTTSDISLRFLLFNQLKAYRSAGLDVYGVSATGPWVADLEQAGIKHLAIPHFTRGRSAFNDARAFAELIRVFRRHKFDIVHLHNPKPGLLGKLAARLTGIPIIVNTIHGLYGVKNGSSGETIYSMKAPWLVVEAASMKLGHFDLSQNREDLDWLRSRGWLGPHSSDYLGNGIDVDHFTRSHVDIERVKRDLGVDKDALVVGTVGRLVWEKGYRELFAAAEGLRSRHPRTAFIVIGPSDPDKRDAVPAAVIARVEASGAVRFLGMRRDVRDLLAAMDVFVLPSHREGFPRSAVEAASIGLPLVLTNIRGCREVVEEGVNGLLVPVHEAEALEVAIERLILDAELRRRMGEASREKALKEFDERRVINRTLGVYWRLLESARLGGSLRSAGKAAPFHPIRRQSRNAEAAGAVDLKAD